MASIWPTQKGHQRPRVKERTSFPLASRSAERTILPLWSCSSKAGAFVPTARTFGGEIALLEFGDGLRVDGLRLRRDIFRDQVLAFGEDLAQRARVGLRVRFFQRAPFHGVQLIPMRLSVEVILTHDGIARDTWFYSHENSLPGRCSSRYARAELRVHERISVGACAQFPIVSVLVGDIGYGTAKSAWATVRTRDLSFNDRPRRRPPRFEETKDNPEQKFDVDIVGTNLPSGSLSIGLTCSTSD